MSTHRYPGGVISATPPTASASSAIGVWTLEEAMRNKQAGNWPDGAGADPYFRNVSMLLHGDGTNGAQNNTFLDGSTNNYTITRSGNLTQGTFDPYAGPGCWSTFYTTTQCGWQTPASSTNNILGSAFNSTATFTVEAWIYPLTRHSGGGAVLGYVLGSMQIAGSSVDWSFGPDSAGNLVVFWYQGGNQICKGGSIIPLNTWTHIAMSVSAGSIKLFVNGVQETTTGPTSITLSTQAVNYVSSGGYLYAGTTWQGFNGYISNLRVVGKRALYSTTFTPSTTPLVATYDTTLLVNNNASLIDSSASNYALTVTNSVVQSKFSAFTLYEITPASYSATLNGTNAYLSLPSSSAFAIPTSTTPFTIEAWIYPISFTGGAIFTDTYTASDTIPISFHLSNGTVVDSTNGQVLTLAYYSGTAWTNCAMANTSVSANQWQHVAAVFTGSTCKLFLNGVDVTKTSSPTPAGSWGVLNDNGSGWLIGRRWDTSANPYFTGSISNLRFVKGTAVYTSNFTPPTAPLTAISGTTLLTCQSTTFIDNSSSSLSVTANGGASPKKANPFTDSVVGPLPYSASTYGGSGYFDGNGDYAALPAGTGFNLLTGDFTIEAWVYPFSRVTNGAYIISQSSYGVGSDFAFWINSTGTLQFYMTTGGANIVVSTGTVPLNAWTHVAVSRSGTSFKLFINGVIDGTLTSSVSITNTYTPVTIGNSTNNSGSVWFQGYISNLRVVKGTAVYTAPFVPPASPVTAVTNTQLLFNATNGGIIDNSLVNDIETGGAAQISTATVKYGTGSISYNGSTSYLTMLGRSGQFNYANTNGSGIFVAGNTFTLEFWIYPTTKVSGAGYLSMILGDANTTSGTALYWGIGLNSSGQAAMSWYDGASKSCSGSTVISNGTWTYIAFVVTAGVVKIYVNGTSETLTGTTTITTPSGTLGTLSSGVDRAQYWAGFLDDLRLTNGVARYSTNFTPPIAAFPNY